ncbi:MAG TPA: ABC transporter permease [Bryobacteraceae bacterium]|nr:ABC transporter permease [Bryobacteraceae bacterium]
MSRRDRRLKEEIESHLRMAIRDRMERGESAAEAEANARREFGNQVLVEEVTRQMWSWIWLEQLWRDVCYGLRGMRRNPGFTAVAILALALGIGANSAIFTAVNAILLRPLGYRDPERLVTILNHGTGPVAPANFVDWKAQSRSFDNMGAAEAWTPDLTGSDRPEKLWALRVSADILPLLGVPPALGRFFTPGEDQPGSQFEVVLGYSLWQRQFGGDSHVLGRRIQLDNQTYTVIGVMPRGFRFAPFWATRAELWAPLALGPRASQRGNSLRLFARLRPGITLEQARAEFSSIKAALERQYPGTNQDQRIVPLKERVVGEIRPALLTLLCAVGFVLLIACANVAHMLLARSATRSHEVAVRAALGAGRGQLLRQFLAESLTLAMLGGAVGLLLAYWGVRAMVRFGPPGIPRLETLSLDWRVAGWTLAVSLVTGILFGLAPALRASGLNSAESLKKGGRASSGTGRQRVRGLLVVSEFALSLMLLIGAGLMLRSFVALQAIDPGFRPDHLLTMILSVGGSPDAGLERAPEFYQGALARVRAIPGVTSAGMTNHLPIAGDFWGLPFWIEGRPLPHPGEAADAGFRLALPGYLETMQIPIVRGRSIDAGDTADSPGVVVINQYMAQTYWPGGNAIGKRLTLDDPSSSRKPAWLTVVGIAKNDVRDDWAAPPAEEIFLPYLQHTDAMGHYITLVVRTKGDPAFLAPVIERSIWRIDRNVTISEVQTMNSVIEGANAEARFNMALLAVFATVATVLSAVGIFGVMSYAATRRRREIGIRLALGARPTEVLQLITREGMVLALCGTAAGIAGALALTRLMAKLLYGVEPVDPLTFIAVPLLLTTVALAACLVPAFRAARTSPVTALRQE